MKMEQWQERTALLLGEEGLDRLKSSTVAVIGTGGVGAYAAEMLIRAGVGRMILVDSDTVSQSNKNRQLLALDSTIGQSKVQALSRRLRDINPAAVITEVEQYITPENVAQMLDMAAKVSALNALKSGQDTVLAASGREYDANAGACDANSVPGIDFLVDAIDTLAPKLALINHCVKNGIPHVSSMGSGAKFDITKVRIADISKSFNCPLAYIVRKRLRREYGISKGFKVVFSEELPEREAIIAEEGRNKKSNVGTISYMPAVFGCACAQSAILFLTENR